MKDRAKRLGQVKGLFSNERGISTLQWIGITAVVLVLLAGIVFYVQTSGAGRIGGAVQTSMNEQIALWEEGGGRTEPYGGPEGKEGEAASGRTLWNLIRDMARQAGGALGDIWQQLCAWANASGTNKVLVVFGLVLASLALGLTLGTVAAGSLPLIAASFGLLAASGSMGVTALFQWWQGGRISDAINLGDIIWKGGWAFGVVGTSTLLGGLLNIHGALTGAVTAGLGEALNEYRTTGQLSPLNIAIATVVGAALGWISASALKGFPKIGRPYQLSLFEGAKIRSAAMVQFLKGVASKAWTKIGQTAGEILGH